MKIFSKILSKLETKCMIYTFKNVRKPELLNEFIRDIAIISTSHVSSFAIEIIWCKTYTYIHQRLYL